MADSYLDQGSTLAVIIDAVHELLAFSRDKAEYDADCRIKEMAKKVRNQLFLSESDRSIVTNKELARCKTKLHIITQEYEHLSDAHKFLFEPLIKELQTRIFESRRNRKR